uniref:Uncharacterized protein n=1 Tax=Arundo donax TaxID=35708 RepID=A0A0A9EWV4_ARUDO
MHCNSFESSHMICQEIDAPCNNFSLLLLQTEDGAFGVLMFDVKEQTPNDGQDSKCVDAGDYLLYNVLLH